MCFNSKVIQREVQQRSALIGKAIQAGVNKLQTVKQAGTVRGRDCRLGNHDRARISRRASISDIARSSTGASAANARRRTWTWNGRASSRSSSTSGQEDSPRPVSRRNKSTPTPHSCRAARSTSAVSKDITYMKSKREITYSQHNHFAPPSVAFGKYHQPGFSTYPQPGLFEDIYEQLAQHKQVGWASCEGTNMQPATGPGKRA